MDPQAVRPGPEGVGWPGDSGLGDSGTGDAGTGDAGLGDGCPGGGPPDIAGMDDSQRRRVLVASTARFAGSFLRWVDSRACGPLTYPRLRVLEALKTAGPAKMADLADQVGISARNMTAVVDALEQAGLVARRPHPADRRAILIELTPGGVRAVETTLGPGLDAVAELFGGLSLREQKQYLKVLGRLLDAMQSPVPPAPGTAHRAAATPVPDQSAQD
jgi:DNA-binding MarR family transcriptional regulator